LACDWKVTNTVATNAFVQAIQSRRTTVGRFLTRGDERGRVIGAELIAGAAVHAALLANCTTRIDDTDATVQTFVTGHTHRCIDAIPSASVAHTAIAEARGAQTQILLAGSRVVAEISRQAGHVISSAVFGVDTAAFCEAAHAPFTFQRRTKRVFGHAFTTMTIVILDTRDRFCLERTRHIVDTRSAGLLTDTAGADSHIAEVFHTGAVFASVPSNTLFILVTKVGTDAGAYLAKTPIAQELV
jgi:hypothetical protein